QRVESGGRYVDRSTPASALGFSSAWAFGFTPCVHIDPLLDHHLGFFLTGGFGVFPVPPATDAAVANDVGVRHASPGWTLFALAGPDVQLAVADEWALHAGVGLGYRGLSVGSASASGGVVQPRLSMDHFDGHGGLGIGVYTGVDAVGPAGHTVSM